MMRVSPKELLCRALRKLGYELRRTKRRTAVDVPLIDVFDLVLRDYLEKNPAPFLVQVGAHDGKTDDPAAHLIRRHGLRALLVEPQPTAYERLLDNYRGGDAKLAFENSLVGAIDGAATLYKAREDMPGVPAMLLQSASLDRKRVEAAIAWLRDENPGLAVDASELIEELTVPSLTWDSLLAKHRVTAIDILVLDTMGFDYELLKLFPFNRVKPDIIHFEHALLSPEDQMACVKLLVAEGYSMAKVAVDTIAVRKARTRRWLFDGWAAASVAAAAELLEVLAPVPGMLGAFT